MATFRTLIMAMFVLSAVYTATAAAGDGVVQAPDYMGPTTSIKSGEYTQCRMGCVSWSGCNERCHKEGYSNGGECVGPFVPENQQCCCLGPYV